MRESIWAKSCPMNGQSLSEFLIVLTLIVPLLLALPAVAKLFEIKNKVTQMGRLATWHPGNTDTQAFNSGADLNTDDLASLALSSSDFDHTQAPKNKKLAIDDWDQMLLDGHRNGASVPLITSISTNSTASETAQSKWLTPMSSAIKLLGITGFSLRPDGMVQHNVSILAAIPDRLVRWLSLESSEITFPYQMSIYSDSWRTPLASDQRSLTASLTPASLLPTDTVQSVLTYSTGFMPWSSAWKKLDLGHIDTAVVPKASVIGVKP